MSGLLDEFVDGLETGLKKAGIKQVGLVVGSAIGGPVAGLALYYLIGICSSNGETDSAGDGIDLSNLF
jgi:hypothetical protein